MANLLKYKNTLAYIRKQLKKVVRHTTKILSGLYNSNMDDARDVNITSMFWGLNTNLRPCGSTLISLESSPVQSKPFHCYAGVCDRSPGSSYFSHPEKRVLHWTKHQREVEIQ